MPALLQSTEAALASVAIPVGAAIVFRKLLGSATELPQAYLQALAQRVRDAADGRSVVAKALAQAVAEKAVASPDLLERAERTLLGRVLRQQQSIEAVVAKSINYLEASAPGDATHPPEDEVSDDFLNRFQTHASDAASEELRDLFARILAGEIRKPGSFSLATLHVVSIMDQRLASTIARARPWISELGIILAYGVFTSGPDLSTISELADIGLLRMGQLNRRIGFGPEGSVDIEHGDHLFTLVGQPGAVEHCPVFEVSPMGEEIFSLIDISLSFDDIRKLGIAYAEILGTKKVLHSTILRISPDRRELIDTRVLFSSSA